MSDLQATHQSLLTAFDQLQAARANLRELEETRASIVADSLALGGSVPEVPDQMSQAMQRIKDVENALSLLAARHCNAVEDDYQDRQRLQREEMAGKDKEAQAITEQILEARKVIGDLSTKLYFLEERATYLRMVPTEAPPKRIVGSPQKLRELLRTNPRLGLSPLELERALNQITTKIGASARPRSINDEVFVTVPGECEIEFDRSTGRVAKALCNSTSLVPATEPISPDERPDAFYSDRRMLKGTPESIREQLAANPRLSLSQDELERTLKKLEERLRHNIKGHSPKMIDSQPCIAGALGECQIEFNIFTGSVEWSTYLSSRLVPAILSNGEYVPAPDAKPIPTP